MPIFVDVAFVTLLIEKAQPAGAPWQSTRPMVAEVIARKSNFEPLFKGDDGPAKTASVAVAILLFESGIKPDAVGDCLEKDDKGMCLPGATPRSYCGFQIERSNLPALGVTREQIVSNFEVCTDAAWKMMKSSFSICKGKDWTEEDLLNQYATGGGVCLPSEKGKHRMLKALWLYKVARKLRVKPG